MTMRGYQPVAAALGDEEGALLPLMWGFSRREIARKWQGYELGATIRALFWATRIRWRRADSVGRQYRLAVQRVVECRIISPLRQRAGRQVPLPNIAGASRVLQFGEQDSEYLLTVGSRSFLSCLYPCSSPDRIAASAR